MVSMMMVGVVRCTHGVVSCTHGVVSRTHGVESGWRRCAADGERGKDRPTGVVCPQRRTRRGAQRVYLYSGKVGRLTERGKEDAVGWGLREGRYRAHGEGEQKLSYESIDGSDEQRCAARR